MTSTMLTGARAARTLWREIVGLLHGDASREDFAGLLDRAKTLPAKVADREDLIHCIELALTVKERFELHQQRERGLLAVLETAQDLTAITDPDRILLAIVQRARKLLGCDVGYLSIYDPNQDAFYVRATDGAFSENFKRVRVPLHVGICGFVARHKTPYASSDYRADNRFPHTTGIDSAVTEENITSILGVPLLASDAVTGVLFVGDRYLRTYTPWEKHILSVLAAHASVALNNAQLFEQAQEALRLASDTNQQLGQRASISQTEMSTLVRSLIGVPSDGLEQTAACAARHGLDLAHPIRIIVLDHLGDRTVLLRRQLATAPELSAAVIDTTPDRLILLANDTAIPDILPHLSAHTSEVLHRAVTGIISGPMPAHDDLRAGYRRLIRCLQVVEMLGGPERLFHEQELSLYALLLDAGQGRNDALRYLSTTLGALYDPDDTRKCRLGRTLLAYLDAGHNAGVAAQTLGIHINTVHQRLTALDGLLEEWRNPARALDIHTALRLWRLGSHRHS